MRDQKTKTVTFENDTKESKSECPCKQLQLPRERPYKVCGGREGERKGIVARSFQELIEKSRKKFCLDEEITLVLFEDRTEIDDEEYFQSLPDNTIFLIVPDPSISRRGRSKTKNSEKFQEKKQRRSKKLDSGNLREISKLLASEGTVAGRGEIIEKDKTSAKSSKSSSSEMKNRRKKAVMVDNVTQVDSITLEFEIAKQYGKKGGSSLVHKVKDLSVSSVTPAPRHLAAQLIRRLETHKRIQDKEVTSCCNNILYPELSPRD